MHGLVSCSIEYVKDTEMLLTSGLNPVIEELRSVTLMILEQIITWVIEKVDGRTIFFEEEPMQTPETDSEKELPPTPDMSPIIRPIEFESSLSLREAEIGIVLAKTKNIILELLLNSAEIYLVQEELVKSKENRNNKSNQGCGKESIKAPYKDGPSMNILQRRNEKP